MGAEGFGEKFALKILQMNYERLEDIDISEVPRVGDKKAEAWQDMIKRLPKLRHVLGLKTELDWPAELVNEPETTS